MDASRTRHLTGAERQFADKVVLITGAGSGIGEACAAAFAAHGAQVVLADVNLGAALARGAAPSSTWRG